MSEVEGILRAFGTSVSLRAHPSTRDVSQARHDACKVDEPGQLAPALPSGKFHLRLRVGWNPVAAGRTISPEAHRIQDRAVFTRPGALQNQRTMHAAISSYDEADADLGIQVHIFQQRIGSRQRLWWLRCSATDAARSVNQSRVFRVVNGGVPKTVFSSSEGNLSAHDPRRYGFHRSETHSGQSYHQRQTPQFSRQHLVGPREHTDLCDVE